MSGSNAFFVLIPAMYLFFTLALAIIGLVERRLVAARWAALSFFIAFASIVVDGYGEPDGNLWGSWFTVATHFLPLLVMIQAFLSRHKRSASVFAMLLTLAACIYLMPNMPWAPPYWLRGMAVQLICATIIASSLPALWAFRHNSIIDLITFIIVFVAAQSYAARTIIIGLNPIGETRQDVLAFYEGLNLVFHSASALMGMAVGIVMMMAIGYDIMRLKTEESEIDPLTSLGNRRSMARYIAEDRTGKSAIGAALVIDLDHFKKVNDRFGHAAGDQVLSAVGKTLNRLFSNFGMVCRVGGEEFVILVDEPNAESTAALGLAARKVISALSFDGPLSQIRITASVGFHHRGKNETVYDAIKRADQAVYCAKTDGRDRVVAAIEESGLQVLKTVG